MDTDVINATRPASIDWNHELVDQLDWHWQHHLRPRLDAMTDHEYRVLGIRAANHFGQPGPVEYPTTEWSLHAQAALLQMDRWYDAWITGVRSLGADGLHRPCCPAEGPFAEYPFAALVLHISREVIHHGAELCTLRHLCRASQS